MINGLAPGSPCCVTAARPAAATDKSGLQTGRGFTWWCYGRCRPDKAAGACEVGDVQLPTRLPPPHFADPSCRLTPLYTFLKTSDGGHEWPHVVYTFLCDPKILCFFCGM